MQIIKRLILTMNTGGNWIPGNVLASHMAAAARWEAQYLQLTYVPEGEAFLRKCDCLSGLGDVFPNVEQVLWLDGDVLVRDDCENLFDMVPLDHFGGVPNYQGDTHNGIPPETQARLAKGWYTTLVDKLEMAVRNPPEGIGSAAEDALGLKYVQLLHRLESTYNVSTFINGGVFVFSPQHHSGVFEILNGATAGMEELDPADEQALLNSAIIEDGTPTTMLDRTYNRVGMSAWGAGDMTEKVQHLAHFRWNGTDSRLFTPEFGGDKTLQLNSINWRVSA